MAAVGSAVEMSYKYSLKGSSGHSGRHITGMNVHLFERKT